MKRMKREKFTPKTGETYQNPDGGIFRCLQSGYTIGEATMQNIKTGWTFSAHGCRIYEDGTTDWDYSTGGYFAEQS